MISIEEAFELIFKTVSPLDATRVNLADAVGRVLIEPVLADVDSPPHTKSIMDGFAVKADDIHDNARLTVIETVIAGDVPKLKVETGTAARIMTGAPVPEGADTVIMIEQAKVTEDSGQTHVRFEIDSIEAGRHTMQRAASFAKGETIFEAGHKIRALDIGLLAEVGAAEVGVFRQPTAGVLPTGNELVDSAKKPGPGQIRNSNGPMLSAMLAAAGVAVTNLGIAQDDPDELKQKIELGLKSDLLLLSGGVSAGLMDLVPKSLQEAGVEEIFHKVKVKPGKPIWFGRRKSSGRTTYVFGLPGNPVSSLIGFELFVRAAIRRLSGAIELQPATVTAELTAPHQARGDRPTYWPGRWVDSDGVNRLVEPLQWLGSSDLRALGVANALILFSGGSRSYRAGEIVNALPN